ncbi:hypothetical protein [Kineococcus aurantiacus]|uniref:Uncharacterized protein n=1 Tax=Kineococcus aurantiacus TaxID=37633 RepID=A0A7Y9J100_9ACTN|nr:hypothetical protein [Kineococcus aurantiacus]NYD22674.1 hypothetical protein [Kineococcus aurantiacus]
MQEPYVPVALRVVAEWGVHDPVRDINADHRWPDAGQEQAWHDEVSHSAHQL